MSVASFAMMGLSLSVKRWASSVKRGKNPHPAYSQIMVRLDGRMRESFTLFCFFLGFASFVLSALENGVENWNEDEGQERRDHQPADH